MLSLRLIPRLMLLSSIADTDMPLPMLVDMPMLTLDTVVDMPMVSTLTPMVPTTLARGLLMLSLRPRLMLMPLSSTADTDMLLPMLVDMPMLTLDTVAMLDSPLPMVATLLMEHTLTWDKKEILPSLSINNYNRNIQQAKHITVIKVLLTPVSSSSANLIMSLQGNCE